MGDLKETEDGRLYSNTNGINVPVPGRAVQQAAQNERPVTFVYPPQSPDTPLKCYLDRAESHHFGPWNLNPDEGAVTEGCAVPLVKVLPDIEAS